MRYAYDTDGDLVSVTDREGNTTELKYAVEDRPHYLNEIVDPLGRSGVRTVYDQLGRLKQVLDVDGEEVELVYDPDNSVQTVLDVFGKPTTYVYDQRGNVLTEIDPLGKKTERTYDEENNVLTETVVTTSDGGERRRTTTRTYDENGNVLTEIDPLGNTTRYAYGDYNRLTSETDALGNTTSYVYDSRGNLLSTEDAAGNATQFEYDSRGNLTQLTDANNNVVEIGYSGVGDVTNIIDEQGNVGKYTYNSNGNQTTEALNIVLPNGEQEIVTEWTYDNEGRIESVTQGDRIVEYEYDRNGNQTASTSSGQRTEYRYDRKGKLVETIYADETPETLEDNPRNITVYDRGGRSRATIGQSGRVTHYEYDALGRQTATIYPDDSINQVEQLLAEIAPNVSPDAVDWTEIVYPDDTPAYLASHPKTSTEYYQTGEVKAEIDEQGNRTEYEYDLLSRRIVTRFDENNYITYTYDAAGNRQTETVVFEGVSTTQTYDTSGFLVAKTDENKNTTRYEYDEEGRLQAIVDALTNRTEYGYNEAGNLETIKDGKGQVTTYQYDELGRRTQVIKPDLTISTTTYNDADNTVVVTDFNGETVESQYDEEGRLVATRFEDREVRYSYEEESSLGTSQELITDSRGTTIYKYDERGRLISRTDPTGPYLSSGATIEYEYENGQVSTVETPGGTTSYTYDEFDRLKTVTDADGDTTTYFYDDAGNLDRTEFPNDVVEVRNYDELDRLTVLKTVLVDSVTGEELEVISSYEYELDNFGNHLSVLEHNGRLVEYEYDRLNRLVRETITDLSEPIENGRIITYTYDAVGNRLSKNDFLEGSTTYTYNSLNQLETSTLNGITTTYTYDDNGNLIFQVDGETSVIYDWVNDGENRLERIAITDDSGTKEIDYLYNAFGIRVGQIVDGVETSFLIDDLRTYAQVIEEYDGNGNLQASYTYGYDLISQERGDEEFFYQADSLGSTRTLTDELGRVTNTYTYDAYRNSLSTTGSPENAYLFAGEQRNVETGLDYLRTRYYNPSIGRFISADAYEGTLDDPFSLHDYQYAHANPVLYTDPSGYFSIAEISIARKIRDDLVAIQLDSYSYLISPTINYAQVKGDYKIGNIIIDVSWNAFFALAPILAPYVESGVQGMIRRMRAGSTAGSGLGGILPVIDELESPLIIQQITAQACGVACAQALLSELGVNVSQETIASLAGKNILRDGANADELKLALYQLDTTGGDSIRWYGQYVPRLSANNIAILNGNGSWIAQVSYNGTNHWIIIDGFSAAGELKVRDPWGINSVYTQTGSGPEYKITLENFLSRWTGLVVCRNKT